MSDTPFDLAIVGSGNIGATYTRAIDKLGEAGVAALVSRSGTRPDYLQACRGDGPPAVPASSARLATELALKIYQAGGRLDS